MYIVGIDIGKNHHEASIVSPEGKQIGPSLRFATTHKGADSLMSFIFKNIGNSPCVFGMEATGWIVNTFLDNFFKVIFPILYWCLITK